MIGLTRRQADCARIVAELNDALGRPPTIRELAGELDLTLNPTHKLVISLRIRGWMAPHRLVLLCDPPPPPLECAIQVTKSGRSALRGRAPGADARPAR